MARHTAAERGEHTGAVVYLGLGSNLGDRAGMLRRALERLAVHVRIDAASDVHESEPWGVTDQPRFLNMVVRGRTKLDPVDLLHVIKGIERDLGRTPTVRMGPRVIDIDLLLFGGISLDRDDLVIPHPGILERAFVLVPLLDVDADLVHPVTGVPLKAGLEALRAAAATMTHLGPLDSLPQDDNAPA